MKRTIKILACFALVTLAASLLSTGAFALTPPLSDFDRWNARWEEEGYPDDIGGVYMDPDTHTPGVIAVDPSPKRIAQLKEMLGEDTRITPGKYSYNELELVRQAVEARMDRPDSKIYGLGIGWKSGGDGVTGFGESGREMRVTVTVDESVFDAYSDEFTRLYGDKVFVEAGGPMELFARDAAPEEDEAQSGVSLVLPILLGMGALAAAVLAVFLRRRRG